MEICFSSKRLPRRPTLLLYLLCLIFVIGAFYSYSGEHSSPSFLPIRIDPEPASVQSPKKSTVLSGDAVSYSTAAIFPNVTKLKVWSRKGERKSTRTERKGEAVTLSPRDRVKGAHDTKYVLASRSSESANSTTVRHRMTRRSTPSPRVNSCMVSHKPPKLILLWTSFFDYWNYLPKGPYKHCSCPNCEVTANRTRLLQSDAVIFHARDMDLADLPPFRLPHQRWIFYCLESPPYSDFPGLGFMHRMFNWTMSYRLDSDVVTTYGAVRKVYPSRKLDLSSLATTWSGKSRSVVWMSSHCPTAGGRDDYVEELRKYIDVDVYGTCGSYNCSQGATERCMQDFSDKYKFFLAFENSICKDYITEKFFRTLKKDIIPVVFGGARYEKFAPPGSFVDALSFKSPKHLAFFLAGIGSNFSLYSSYFLWRRDFEVTMDSRRECDLCALLHRKDLKPSSYEDLRSWWVHESKCWPWRPKKVVD